MGAGGSCSTHNPRPVDPHPRAADRPEAGLGPKRVLRRGHRTSQKPRHSNVSEMRRQHTSGSRTKAPPTWSTPTPPPVVPERLRPTGTAPSHLVHRCTLAPQYPQASRSPEHTQIGGFYTPTPYNWRMNPPGQRYDKPALNENELIERYIERGLTITDRNRAARHLRHIEAYSWGVCDHEAYSQYSSKVL